MSPILSFLHLKHINICTIRQIFCFYVQKSRVYPPQLPPKLQPIDSLMQSDAIAFGVGIDLRLEFELEFWNSQKILLQWPVRVEKHIAGWVPGKSQAIIQS